jgi:hypothetical protein
VATLGRTPGNLRATPRRRLLCGVLPLLAVLSTGIAGCRFDNPATGRATDTSQVPTSSAQVMRTAVTASHGAESVLVSSRLDDTPVVDGDLKAEWEHSIPLELPLTWGWDGEDVALRVEMRSLHNDEMVCFGARWSGQPPPREDDGTLNKLTVHWQIPSRQVEDRGHLDCSIVCHTAFANTQGRILYMNAETIPQGGDAALQSAGRWESGVWTVEWCRPLKSDNPYDLQFTALDAEYPFRVKVFKRIEGQPDPVSGLAFLRFDA